MVDLHRNGDIVTHPDHAANYRARMDQYDRRGKCRYGVIIAMCSDYINAENQRISAQSKPEAIKFSRCNYGMCGVCPRYIAQKQYGETPKKFRITNTHYRRIADQAAYLKETQKFKLLFITLTFGKFKKNGITDKQANECFSKFMENLSANYGRGNYIAVKEHGDENNRVHFHLIIDMPFVDFRALNRAWCAATSDYCDYSPNALTTDREARFIKSTVSAVKYICKYISKARGQESNSRVIFTSRELSQAELKTDFSGNDFTEILRQYRSIQVYRCNDYTWRYSISYPKGAPPEQKERARKAANVFYYTVVRAMFGHFDKKPTTLHIFPTENTQ